MRVIQRITVMLIALAVAGCAHVSSPVKRLSYKEEVKADVWVDYWGLDGPIREALLYLHLPPPFKDHVAKPLTQQQFVRKLDALNPKRGFVWVQLAATPETFPEKTLDETVRFFRGCGFQRVVIVQADGAVLRDTAHPD